MEKELKSIVDDYFRSLNYKIIDFILRGEKGTKVLEIFVDNREGISIDELAKINRDLNNQVDDNLVIKDISKLVVSSPGIERSFKYLWQLQKHIGRVIELMLDNGERLEGKLIEIFESDEGYILLDISKREKHKEITQEFKKIDFKAIKESRVKISFSK